MPPPLPGHQLKAFDIFPKIGKKLSMQMQRAGSFHKVQQRKLPPRRRWGWEGVRGGGFRYISLFFCVVCCCVCPVYLFPFSGRKRFFNELRIEGKMGIFGAFFFVFFEFSVFPRFCCWFCCHLSARVCARCGLLLQAAGVVGVVGVAPVLL